MKLGFWFDYDHTYTFVKLFNALQRRIPSAKASGFVVSDRYLGHARENLPPQTTLISFHDLLAKARAHRPTAAELADFRAFDERHRLSRIAYSDRHLAMWSYDELISHYIHMMAAFRKYIETEKPDVFIFGSIAAQHAHLFYYVLRDMGVRVLLPHYFGIENLHNFCDNPYELCPEVWGQFNAFQDGRDTPTPEERDWAQGYIARIREGQPPYVNKAVALETRKFSLPKFGRVYGYLRNYVLYDRKDPHQVNPLRRIANIVRLRINRALSKRYLRDPRRLEGDYVLFPLHYEPEIATLVISQYDQMSVIDIIIRQLPLGCRLVAKEHPVMMGQRSWKLYRDALRKYPNLVFVTTKMTVNQLARKARALLTLNGTPILEAFILGCPVIYTARARFGGFGVGAFTENLISFADALDAAKRSVPDDATLVAMLSAIHRQCRRFEFMEPLGNPRTLADDNIDRMADAFMEQLAPAQA